MSKKSSHLPLSTSPTGTRRHRLTIAAAAAFVFMIAVAGYLATIGDDHVGGTELWVYNLVGLTALLTTIAFLIAGLATRRRSPADA